MTKRDAKKTTSAELKQLQALLGWTNEKAAEKLGVCLKTFVNWRNDGSRIPYFLKDALNYHIHLENMKFLEELELKK